LFGFRDFSCRPSIVSVDTHRGRRDVRSRKTTENLPEMADGDRGPAAARTLLVLAGGELPTIRKLEVQNVFSQVVWPNLIIWVKTL
jgi:hypothetical protein